MIMEKPSKKIRFFMNSTIFPVIDGGNNGGNCNGKTSASSKRRASREKGGKRIEGLYFWKNLISVVHTINWLRLSDSGGSNPEF